MYYNFIKTENLQKLFRYPGACRCYAKILQCGKQGTKFIGFRTYDNLAKMFGYRNRSGVYKAIQTLVDLDLIIIRDGNILIKNIVEHYEF